MIVDGTRFGQIELHEERIITFRTGLLGFPTEKRFVLLERTKGGRFAWLQSLDTPILAFPVIDAASLSVAHPEEVIAEAAKAACLPTTDLAVLVLVAVQPEQSTITLNMLAPLIVDVQSMLGVQAVLDHRNYAASAPLASGQPGPGVSSPQAERLTSG